MIKRLFIVTIVIAILGILVAFVNLNRYFDFTDNKKLAIEYVENKFDFNYKLIESKMSKNSYPAPYNDSFVFYDSDNKLYFIVICYDKELRDLYDESTKEKIVLP